MKILAIDSATNAAVVAVTDGATPLSELGLETGPRRGERLAWLVDQALGQAGLALAEIEAYAIGLGPGSFSGLRTTLAFVKGLAIASPRPVAGASTLEAMARGAGAAGKVVPLIDARKGEVFAAIFQADGRGGLTRMSGDLALSPARLAERIDGEALFLGDGLRRYRDELEAALGRRAVFAPETLWTPRAALVATVAFERLERGEADDADALVPIYARSSDAELRLGPRRP